MTWKSYLLFDFILLVLVVAGGSLFFIEQQMWHFYFALVVTIFGGLYGLYLLFSWFYFFRKMTIWSIIVILARILLTSGLVYLTLILTFMNLGAASRGYW